MLLSYGFVFKAKPLKQFTFLFFFGKQNKFSFIYFNFFNFLV